MQVIGKQVCGVCGRTPLPGIFQVNVCRAFASLDFVARMPGLTAWEISQKTGTPYIDIMEGLNKARAHQWARAVSEDREQGGIRYRYYPLEDASLLLEAMAAHRAAVARQAGLVAP